MIDGLNDRLLQCVLHLSPDGGQALDGVQVVEIGPAAIGLKPGKCDADAVLARGGQCFADADVRLTLAVVVAHDENRAGRIALLERASHRVKAAAVEGHHNSLTACLIQACRSGVAFGDQNLDALFGVTKSVHGAGLASALLEEFGAAFVRRDVLQRPELSIDVARRHDEHVTGKAHTVREHTLAAQVDVGAILWRFRKLVPTRLHARGGLTMLLHKRGRAALFGQLHLRHPEHAIVTVELRSVGGPRFLVAAAEVLDVTTRAAVKEADVGTVLRIGLSVDDRKTVKLPVHDRIAFEYQARAHDGRCEFSLGRVRAGGD